MNDPLVSLLASTRTRMDRATEVVREARQVVEARTRAYEALVAEVHEELDRFDPDLREPEFDDAFEGRLR